MTAARSVDDAADDVDGLPDIRSVPPDLVVPHMTEGAPAPGARVRQVMPEYQGRAVYHAFYLPDDWEAGRRYPVIVEYAGNGPYRNAYGDVCTGRVEDCNLGYGIGGGVGFIWACLPYVSADGQRNEGQWWGDVVATVAYCKTAVARICDEYGGDPDALFVAGFSRGAIACNFIGLHGDEIASLWRGFVAHGHYDGVRAWGYAGDDRRSAARRLARLRGRAQWVSHERSVEETKRYLREAGADGAFAFRAIPYRNHTDAWVLRDIPARRALRGWVKTLSSGMTSKARPGMGCKGGSHRLPRSGPGRRGYGLADSEPSRVS